MPYFNIRGRSCMGIAGGIISVDGVQVDSGGGATWLSDDEIIYQHIGADGTYIRAYNVVTGKFRKVDARGCNFLAAGGSQWVAYAGTMFGSNWPYPAAGIPGQAYGQAVGPDGSIAYIPDYQQGSGLMLRSVSGAESVLQIGGAAYDVQNLGGGKLIWRNVNTITTAGLPSCVQVGGAFRPRATLVGGQWWVAYYSTTVGGVVLHPFDSTVGYVAIPGDNGFAHDIIADGADIKLVWAVREGELPSDYRTTVQKLSEPRVELNKPNLRYRTEGVPAFGKKLWTGYVYALSDRYGDNLTAPGNAQIVIEDGAIDRAVAAGKKLIVPLSLVDRVPYEQLVAVWIHGTSMEEIEQQTQEIRDHFKAKGLARRPVLGYWDSAEPWPRMPNPAPDWFNPNVYHYVGESLDQMKARYRDVAKAFGDKPILLMCQAYNTNDMFWKDPQRLIDLQYAYADLVREDNRIIGIHWFSDGRGPDDKGQGGTRILEYLRPVHRQIEAARAPGDPALTAVTEGGSQPTTGAPAVTFASYPTTVQPGQPARCVADLRGGKADTISWRWRVNDSDPWTVAAKNPASDTDHSFVWTREGVYSIGIKVEGPDGANSTGAKRTITVVAAPVPPTPEPEPPVVVPEPEPEPPVVVPEPPVVTPPTPPAPKPRLSWWQKFLRALGIK